MLVNCASSGVLTRIANNLVLGRRLYRQIAPLLASEDAIDVTGCVPKLVIEIWRIRDQSAGCGKPAKAVTALSISARSRISIDLRPPKPASIRC